MIMNLHHIISDAWSVDVLQTEFFGSYFAVMEGKTAEFAELPLQFADYAVWQRRELEGPRLEQLLQYWRTQLSDVSALELPTDRPRPAALTYHGARHTFELRSELVAQLKSLSQAEGVTLHAILDEVTEPVAAWPNGWADFDAFKSSRFGTAAERASGNAANILNAKRQAFHYCVFADQHGDQLRTSSAFGDQFFYAGGDLGAERLRHHFAVQHLAV